MLTLEADGGVIPTPGPTPGRRNLPLCHSDPRANARGRGICFPSTVIEFQVFYEPQNSYRYSRRHRRRRPEIHPDAGAPPLVRSGLAGRFRPLRGQALCRSSALEAQDSDSVRSRRHDGLAGHSCGRAENYFCRPRRLHCCRTRAPFCRRRLRLGLVLALAPLHQKFGLETVMAVPMQAISGAGYPGVASLDILGNVIPYIRNEEEKMEEETKKLLGQLNGSKIIPGAFAMSAQCNRVAVEDGHTESVSIRLKTKAKPQEI